MARKPTALPSAPVGAGAPTRALPAWAIVVIVYIGYVATSRLGLLLAIPPGNASPLFAKNLANFLDLMVGKDGTLKIDEADECIKGTMIAKDGGLVHAMFQGAK